MPKREVKTPMDKFWNDWGPVVKVMGSRGFQNFCKQYGGVRIPTFRELLNVGRGEVMREKVAQGIPLVTIRHNDRLAQGRIEEVLKEFEREGKEERKKGEDEYGDPI